MGAECCTAKNSDDLENQRQASIRNSTQPRHYSRSSLAGQGPPQKIEKYEHQSKEIYSQPNEKQGLITEKKEIVTVTNTIKVTEPIFQQSSTIAEVDGTNKNKQQINIGKTLQVTQNKTEYRTPSFQRKQDSIIKDSGQIIQNEVPSNPEDIQGKKRNETVNSSEKVVIITQKQEVLKVNDNIVKNELKQQQQIIKNDDLSKEKQLIEQLESTEIIKDLNKEKDQKELLKVNDKVVKKEEIQEKIIKINDQQQNPIEQLQQKIEIIKDQSNGKSEIEVLKVNDKIIKEDEIQQKAIKINDQIQEEKNSIKLLEVNMDRNEEKSQNEILKVEDPVSVKSEPQQQIIKMNDEIQLESTEIIRDQNDTLKLDIKIVQKEEPKQQIKNDENKYKIEQEESTEIITIRNEPKSQNEEQVNHNVVLKEENLIQVKAQETIQPRPSLLSKAMEKKMKVEEQEPENIPYSQFRVQTSIPNKQPEKINSWDTPPDQKILRNIKLKAKPGKLNPLFLEKLHQKITCQPNDSTKEELEILVQQYNLMVFEKLKDQLIRIKSGNGLRERISNFELKKQFIFNNGK